jgi:PhzF family phenazine biosynthesis protein
VLPVEVVREAGQPAVVWMDQSPPQFGEVAGDRARLAVCLGLGQRDLLVEDAQVVSTGAGHLLVPARDRGAVDRAVPDPARLVPVLRRVGAEGCYLYSQDPVDAAGAVAYARFFNPAVGIAEDPATGTAAGPLAARLVAAGRGSQIRVTFGNELIWFNLATPRRDCFCCSGAMWRNWATDHIFTIEVQGSRWRSLT